MGILRTFRVKSYKSSTGVLSGSRQLNKNFFADSKFLFVPGLAKYLVDTLLLTTNI
jgi:hypothetical protein